MRVLMISTDRKILEEGSAVRARMVDYGTICEELHIVITTSDKRQATNDKRIQVAENVFAYPAVASGKILALIRAYFIAISLLPKRYTLNAIRCLVTSQDPFENGFIAWLVSKKIGAKLELQIHTDFLSPYYIRESLKNKIRVLLANFLMPKADGIRVVSERIRNSLQATSYKLQAVPIVLPIFVDIEAIRKKEPMIDLRKKYPQFDFIILTASRLTKEKNIGLALRAMSEVVKKHPKVGLAIIGSGPEEKNLKLKAKNLKLEANTIFEKWTNDPISFYKTADTFLNTSNYEGFGMAIAEAAASDCPIVTTDVGIIDGIFKHEENVLVCAIGDIKCIATQIERLITYPQLRTRLASKAQTAVGLLSIKKETYLERLGAAWWT